MLTDWLIFLDLLEDYNFNTTFLRLITPITFGIFECHNYNYTKGSGNGNGYGNGYGYSYSYDFGFGFGYNYLNSYDEEH